MFQRLHLLFILVFCSQVLWSQRPARFDSLLVQSNATLFFASGSADLDSTSLQVLARFPLQDSTANEIYLTAHTDDIGSVAFNEELAQKRAHVAMQQLIQQGWSKDRLTIQTFGERQPVNDNTTEVGRQDNRRVTIELLKPIPVIQYPISVTDATTGDAIPGAQIRLHNRQLTDTITLDSTGQKVITLAADSIYGIDVFAKNYFLVTKYFRATEDEQASFQFELAPTDIGATADIANLYFVPSRAILLPQSRHEPEKVKFFLELNPHLKVEIAGHMNLPNRPPVAETTGEWVLSVSRAKFLHDWLLENGIAQEQITFQGYGNHEMRFPRAYTADQMRQNRRVEIRIIGTITPVDAGKNR